MEFREVEFGRNWKLNCIKLDDWFGDRRRSEKLNGKERNACEGIYLDVEEMRARERERETEIASGNE